MTPANKMIREAGIQPTQDDDEQSNKQDEEKRLLRSYLLLVLLPNPSVSPSSKDCCFSVAQFTTVDVDFYHGYYDEPSL